MIILKANDSTSATSNGSCGGDEQFAWRRAVVMEEGGMDTAEHEVEEEEMEEEENVGLRVVVKKVRVKTKVKKAMKKMR
ncbi:hypothetical protein Q3G72_023789 [Acer saccharum]|nr:hypothetical protein Q3G72_023789 [Acer saccharum]